MQYADSLKLWDNIYHLLNFASVDSNDILPLVGMRARANAEATHMSFVGRHFDFVIDICHLYNF